MLLATLTTGEPLLLIEDMARRELSPGAVGPGARLGLPILQRVAHPRFGRSESAQPQRPAKWTATEDFAKLPCHDLPQKKNTLYQCSETYVAVAKQFAIGSSQTPILLVNILRSFSNIAVKFRVSGGEALRDIQLLLNQNSNLFGTNLLHR